MTRMLWILVVLEQTNLLLTSSKEFVYFSLSNDSIFRIYFLLLEILICKVRFDPNNLCSQMVTSMLMTDVGEILCWELLQGVDDRFCPEKINNKTIKNHKHNAYVTNISNR